MRRTTPTMVSRKGDMNTESLSSHSSLNYTFSHSLFTYTSPRCNGMYEMDEAFETKPDQRLMGTAMKWFKNKGYGLIQGDNGKVAFVHASAFTAVEDTTTFQLAAGQRLQYTPGIPL